MTSLGDQLLLTREGAAFLACAAAVGRMHEALAEPGLTLCLAAHALGEVRRGTDNGRLAAFVAAPGAWLLEAAAAVDDADTAWWSASPEGRVLRQTGERTTGIEVVDGRGRQRSAAEEARAHLHTFSHRPVFGPPRRLRLADGARVRVLDGDEDVDGGLREAVDSSPPADAVAVHLTLRGALTVDRGLLPRWPWAVAGIHWPHGIRVAPVEEAASVPEPRVVHDYDWAPIGRPYDPRFDEGDEIDGSELTGVDASPGPPTAP